MFSLTPEPKVYVMRDEDEDEDRIGEDISSVSLHGYSSFLLVSYLMWSVQ